jgi:Bacteriodetes cell division protein (FtsL-like)
MDKNIYKSQKRKGLFTYLEHTMRFKDASLHGLPGRYMPRLLFLLLMGIFYVGNTHYHERLARKISQLERTVDALRVDYTTLQADYMFDSKQSEIAKRVAKLGLYETPHPPLKMKRK